LLTVAAEMHVSTHTVMSMGPGSNIRMIYCGAGWEESLTTNLNVESFVFLCPFLLLVTVTYILDAVAQSSIVTRLRVGWPGFDFRQWLEFFFSLPPQPDRLWGPPSLLSNRYRGFFPLGVNRPGVESDHSPPSSAIRFISCKLRSARHEESTHDTLWTLH
jgi:hypothetical protein